MLQRRMLGVGRHGGRASINWTQGGTKILTFFSTNLSGILHQFQIYRMSQLNLIVLSVTKCHCNDCVAIRYMITINIVEVVLKATIIEFVSCEYMFSHKNYSAFCFS